MSKKLTPGPLKLLPARLIHVREDDGGQCFMVEEDATNLIWLTGLDRVKNAEVEDVGQLEYLSDGSRGYYRFIPEIKHAPIMVRQRTFDDADNLDLGWINHHVQEILRIYGRADALEALPKCSPAIMSTPGGLTKTQAVKQLVTYLFDTIVKEGR